MSGPDSGSPCIFPFTFRSVTYRECAEDKDGRWCSTKVRMNIFQYAFLNNSIQVDKNGIHVGGAGNWGTCSRSCENGLDVKKKKKICKTVSGPKFGKKCVFPFIYKHRKYEKCTTIEHGTPWCSTMVDKHFHKHIAGHWGNCGDGCQM